MSVLLAEWIGEFSEAMCAVTLAQCQCLSNVITPSMADSTAIVADISSTYYLNFFGESFMKVCIWERIKHKLVLEKRTTALPSDEWPVPAMGQNFLGRWRSLPTSQLPAMLSMHGEATRAFMNISQSHSATLVVLLGNNQYSLLAWGCFQMIRLSGWRGKLVKIK